MPKPKPAAARRKASPVAVVAVRPIAARLARMESLLLEMRAALDTQIKRTARLQVQVDTLMLSIKRRV